MRTVRSVFAAIAATVLAAAVVMCGEGFAQSASEKPSSEKPAADKSATEMPKAYLPGLEVFMGTIQRQHEKLWFAARARNWELTEYQLGEMKEVMGVVQDLVPQYKNVPVKDMIDAVITGPITDMEKAIEAKDYRAFVANYDKITAACNTCHEGAGRGFIRMRRPLRNSSSNQVFAPHR